MKYSQCVSNTIIIRDASPLALYNTSFYFHQRKIDHNVALYEQDGFVVSAGVCFTHTNKRLEQDELQIIAINCKFCRHFT